MQALAIGSSSASVNRKASLGVTSSIANGATLSGTVKWTATVTTSAPTVVLKVSFVLDGKQVSTVKAAPWVYAGSGALDTTALADGTHKLGVNVVGQGGSGALASTVATVVVANKTTTKTPPTTTTTTTTTTSTTTTTTTTPTTTTPTPPPTPSPSTGYTGSNRYGVALGGSIQYVSAAERNARLDDVAALGAGWIRFDLQWTNIQHSNATTWDWSAHDPVVTGATARNLKVVAVLTTSPGWANGGQAWNTPPSSAAGISAYGTFCAASAQHYGPLGVKVYEVWNEPNLSGFFQPAPNVAQYTAMLKACYAAIKQVDPSLIVLSGGLAPVGGYATGDPAHPENVNQVKFLEGIYANGGKGSFDAVAVHPYSWPAPPSGTHPANAWYEMSGTSPSIRSVMTANGEASKLVWGTEFGSPSGGLSGLTETAQDLGVQDALALWKSDSWGAVLFYYAGKDGQDGGSGFFSSYGLTRSDGSHKPAWASMHALIPTS